MSLDINLTAVRTVNVLELNIPHCYKPIAAKAGIDQYIWRPFELGIHKAAQLIQPLQIGLRLLEVAPAQFETFPQEYFEQFVGQVRTYLEACKANPDAEVSATS